MIPRNIVVTGATGFVGRALVLYLTGRGDRVTALVRDVPRATALLGPDVVCVAAHDPAALDAAIATAEAVIHLAGASIARGRWTARRKRELVASRIETASSLLASIRRRQTPLPIFLSASAVGYYGDRGDELLDEAAPRGDGFAASLCEVWEQFVQAGADACGRVARLRFGIVLGRHGGALDPLARIARLGLAGPIGNGRQWVPWIHIEDLVRAVGHVLDTASISGAVNVVAPEPVRQRELATHVAEAVGRRAFVRTPKLALAAFLGEGASLVLASQRCVPAVLAATGFTFRHRDIVDALADLFDGSTIAMRTVSRDEVPDSTYLAARRPRYVLATRTLIDRPLDEVLPFFTEAANLTLLTPPDVAFTIATPAPIAMHAGTAIDYTIRMSGVPLRWRTVIERWEPTRGFVDAQYRGPYRAWWHEHRFRRDGTRTVMDDVVYYAPPFGILGRLANAVFVGRKLRDIFAYRSHVIRLRFAAP